MAVMAPVLGLRSIGIVEARNIDMIVDGVAILKSLLMEALNYYRVKRSKKHSAFSGMSLAAIKRTERTCFAYAIR